MGKFLCLISFFFSFFVSVQAQKKNAAFALPIHRTTAPIHIDGKIDEEVWKTSEVARDFYMVLPMDTSRASVKTEVMMTYDSSKLYLLAICYNALPGPYMVE